MGGLRSVFLGLWWFVRRVVPALIGLAGLVLVIAWLSGFFLEKIEPGQETAAARTFTGGPEGVVGEVVKDYEEEALGTLKAADRTAVSSRVMARIEEIRVEADDLVKHGDVLVRLQQDDLQARVNQARESLTAAIATQAEAESNFKRIESLYEQKATTKSQFDSAVAARDVSQAEVRRAEQALQEAQTLLSFGQIVAPREGRIVDRLAEPGDMAIPGQPLLTLYDPHSLRLEVPVREDLAISLDPGSQVTVHIDALNRDMSGTIAQRVPQAEAASRSFLVKVDLPAVEGLYEGMFGRLKIPAGSRRHLCLATAAIREIGQLQFVDVIRGDNTLERRFIKTGRRGFPGKIEVLSGVEAGERVVLHESDDHGAAPDETPHSAPDEPDSSRSPAPAPGGEL